ncbi:Phage integrase family protein [Novipirellula aureliae]|uniref:Phage integrase family protein n=1 Tax=Novipirellula aureliae TaxID=2527966 RepID=A0A5C6E3L8_9BACT|nr:Phage integrase family protein [Novipirellula aureliae]
MMNHDLKIARATWIAEAGDADADADAEKEIREASDYLKYENAAGLFADFHANRHTFITNLAHGGVLPKVAQTLARHSDIRLTMNTYTHTDLNEQVAAIAKLPSFTATPNPATVDKATGDPEAVQRHSSTSVAGDGEDRQFMAEAGIIPECNCQDSDCRKSFENRDLSGHDNACHRKEEVHPEGFEPPTLGSEDQGDQDSRTCFECRKVFEFQGLRRFAAFSHRACSLHKLRLMAHYTMNSVPDSVPKIETEGWTKRAIA